MNVLLDMAIRYANMGLYVFPCREKHEGKYFSPKMGCEVEALPKRPRTPNGLHDASTDVEQIKKWWTTEGWENSCIGINCGKSKLFVIDVDTHKTNGFKEYDRLKITDSGAWFTITPNNGMHVIFSNDEEIGRTHSNETTGIDTRAKGGYIIAPPSAIYDNEGNKKSYVAKWEWVGKPAQVTLEVLNKLGIAPLNIKVDRFVPPTINVARDIEKARKALEQLPFNYLENYQSWVNVGMSLRSLGDDGFTLWSEWTEKYFEEYPKSKRRNQLQYKWKSFFQSGSTDGIGLGSLIFWAKKAGANVKR